MLGEQQTVLDVLVRARLDQFLRQQILLKQLFLQPQRHRHAERRKPAWREGDVGFQQPFEFQERLLVEDDVIDVVDADAAEFQARRDGVMRKRRIVFAAREALFLRRRDDIAVDDERRGAVVIERRDSENIHDDPRTACK
jgi:hypothetical protein